MSDLLLRAQQGDTLVLTLNRPDKLNALNFALIDAVQTALDEAELDPAVRSIVLTGSGEVAFSAGADILEFSSIVEAGVDAALKDFVRRGQAFTRRLENYPKPIIGAVNGLAFGGGCEVVEALPLAIATEHARFAKPEITLGFPPPYGGTQRLPRLIGRKRALNMILTGEPITAAEACRMGLVNSVVPNGQLLDEALALASTINAMNPAAVTASLASVTRGLNLSIDEGLANEAMQFAYAVQSGGTVPLIHRFLARKTNSGAAS